MLSLPASFTCRRGGNAQSPSADAHPVPEWIFHLRRKVHRPRVDEDQDRAEYRRRLPPTSRGITRLSTATRLAARSLRAVRSGIRAWDGPACSLDYLRAARSGIRAWGGPARSLDYLRAARSGIRAWDGPARSCDPALLQSACALRKGNTPLRHRA